MTKEKSLSDRIEGIGVEELVYAGHIRVAIKRLKDLWPEADALHKDIDKIFGDKLVK